MKCSHERLKSFVFSTGQTIECCPDCSKGDTARQALLAGVTKKKTARDVLDDEEARAGYSYSVPTKPKPAVDSLLVPDRDEPEPDEPSEQGQESNSVTEVHAEC
jgi:hypothetical protein